MFLDLFLDDKTPNYYRVVVKNTNLTLKTDKTEKSENSCAL